MRRAVSIAELGVGLHDGEPALLVYGGSEAQLRWNLAAGKWRSAPRPTIRMRGDWRLKHNGAVVNAWVYLSAPEGNVGQIGQSSYTWDPFSIRDADAAYAAGLHLQEHLSAVFWNFTLGEPHDIAVVRYAVTDGDMISTLAVPAPNVAAFLTSGNGVRKWQTTGWVDSAIPTPAKAILAPHLYTRFTVATTGAEYVEYLRAMWRWSS